MQRLWLSGIAVAVLALGGAPALDAAPPTPAPGFELSSCAQPTTAAPAPSTDLGLPESIEMAVCSASTTCSGGSTISCNCPGSGVCTSTATSVTCDCSPDPDFYYTCPTPECSNGEMKQEPDGCCTPYKGRFRWWECVDGSWQPTQYTTCYGACQPQQ